MKELFEIGREIEHVFQVFSIPQDTLNDLLTQRESLIECLEEVGPKEAELLKEQNARIMKKCQEARDALDRQIEAVNNKNRKSLMSQRFGKFYDSRC